MKRIIILFLLVPVVLLAGCAGKQETIKNLEDVGNKSPTVEEGVTVKTDDPGELEYNTLSDLENAKSFAITTGTVFDVVVKERFPQAEMKYYSNTMDCAIAVATGKVDAMVYDAPTLAYISASTDGVKIMPEYIKKENYHFILSKSTQGEALQKEFNQWLDVQRQKGELERLFQFWCSTEEPEDAFDFESLPDTNGTIIMAVSTGSRPDSYIYNNGLAGYPMEVMYRFCQEKGYGVQASIFPFDSCITSIATQKADISASLISYTEERAKSVLFTDPIIEGGIGVLVRKADVASGGTFIDMILKGLERTFVTEERWRMVVSGLGVTLLITLGGFVLANLLGGIFCACNLSELKGLRILADVYNRIMQGTPMVVILMILYYVVFGKSHLSGVWVGIMAFGLNSGAALAQQFSGAITGVDKGQTEAALAMGFTKYQAFMGIVFPQAARTALNGYFSELISLMKGTAIVGYIAVVDLTKASDLIRSSTFDAFFPLLSVALIYFLIAFGLLSLLKGIQKKLAPKRVGSKEEAK